VDPQTLPLPAESLEARLAWFAAWLSVMFTAIAVADSRPLRAIAIAVCFGMSVALVRGYLRRATPLLCVLTTLGAGVVSTVTMVWLSGIPLSAGKSFSQSGGSERPMAWLLTTTSWCLAAGILASGRLVLQAGYRREALTRRGYLAASVLPMLSFLGFLVVGTFQVGGSRALALAHNWAAWAAMGAFWFGMLATPWLRSVSRPLRYYSTVASLFVFGTWLPCGLKFLGFTKSSPISTLHMELVVFTLCFTWFVWLAWEWGAKHK